MFGFFGFRLGPVFVFGIWPIRCLGLTHEVFHPIFYCMLDVPLSRYNKMSILPIKKKQKNILADTIPNKENG